jgi:hypothetical protein
MVAVAQWQGNLAQNENGTEGSIFSLPRNTEWSLWKRQRRTGK